ncbi:zinc finger matrin-type protein 4 isoform X2 [Paralichthys olivaceus]|uniref:zinc finger matrin-type protein 4 isoform X2 n=1 Tax=Paralichthys olivaceus TaxID=8255 RepID=UPI003753CBE5
MSAARPMGAQRGGEQRTLYYSVVAAAAAAANSGRVSRLSLPLSTFLWLMDYTVSLQVQHQLAVFPTHFYQGYSVELQMKSTEVDQGLFTDSYCKVCSAQLISESQRVAHYESRKHANKVRLYYMLHPVDGGCPAKKLRTDNGSDEGDVDKNKCCTLCNMSFTSAVVAQSHYQGKIHAKRLKLLLGEQPVITTKEASPSPVKSSPETSPMTSPRQRRDSDRYCQLCNAWFNNPGMAQQHYDGKKHKKNAARADLLEQLGKTLDMGEMKAMWRAGCQKSRRSPEMERALTCEHIQWEKQVLTVDWSQTSIPRLDWLFVLFTVGAL